MTLSRKKKRKLIARSPARLKRILKIGCTLSFILVIFLLTLFREKYLPMGSSFMATLGRGNSNASYTSLLMLSFGLPGKEEMKSLKGIFVAEENYDDDDDDRHADGGFSDGTTFQTYDSPGHHLQMNKTFETTFMVIRPNKFIVDTPGCKIPDYSPFHPSVKVFMAVPLKIDCTLPVEGVTTSSKNILYFHPEKLPYIFHEQFTDNPSFPSFKNTLSYRKLKDNYAKVSFTNNTNGLIATTSSPTEEQKTLLDAEELSITSSLTCCYKSITRITQPKRTLNSACDGRWKYSHDCTEIVQEKTVIEHDSIFVYCNSSSESIYTNVHHFIIRDKVTSSLTPPSKSDELSAESQNAYVDYEPKEAGELKNKLSVIIFGTDSVSRLNFIRKLPKTYSFLTEYLEALEFKGYNKVGDNTFPNMVPVLSGVSSSQLKNHSCLPKKRPKVFDDCPWIWKDFKNNGFVTAFMEDSPWMGIFNYVHPGFLNPPTDYYGRPYFLASEKLIGRVHKGNSNVCQGNRLSLQVLHDYSLEFMKAFANHPTFSLFWSASLTHDFVNFAGLADDPHLRYLKSLDETGALNRSVLIFMSDHGMRWGKLRKTYIGTLEERLPFFFMVLPKWFKARYPEAYSNLETNTASLISNYDVYETLLDIATAEFASDSYDRSGRMSESKGISLFQKVPVTRTCEEASIPQHYCTCAEMKFINTTDPVVVGAANYIKDFLNEELNLYTKCLKMESAAVVNSHISVWNQQQPPKKNVPSSALDSAANQSLFLQVKLSPGSAVVEATVRVKRQLSHYLYEVVGEISRINSYGHQSHCITHDILRKFCICRDLLLPRQWKKS